MPEQTSKEDEAIGLLARAYFAARDAEQLPTDLAGRALDPVFSPHRTSWRRSVAALLAAIVVAGAIGGGYLLFHGRGEISGVSPPSTPQLVLQDAAAGATQLETMPVGGGQTHLLPALPLSGPLEEVGQVIGHRTDAVLLGSSSAIAALDVEDLGTGTWTQLTLPEALPILQAGAPWNGGVVVGNPGGPVLSPSQGDLALVEVYPGFDTIIIIDLSKGSERSLTPIGSCTYVLRAWLSDGIHISASCPPSSGSGADTAARGYVVDPTGGTMPPGPTGPDQILGATRQPDEDGDVQIAGSPDGTGEAVTTSAGVLAGPAGGPLSRIYTVPLGATVHILAVGDDGQVLLAVSVDGSSGELLASSSGTVATVPPRGGSWPSEPSASAFALPSGGFVQLVASAKPNATAAPGQAVITIHSDGSTSVGATVTHAGATLVGVAW